MKRIISYTICGIVLATTLNSCHIYKKYERPEVDVQGLFRDTVSVTDTLAADSLNIGNLPWTEIFTDPILQGLSRQGLENNSDLQSAMLQVEAAQASFRAAQLAFLPSLNLAPQGGVSSFDGARHLVTGLKERAYDPTRPLITVWDFNVAPQMSVLSAQIDYENKKVYILEEILGRPEEKENNTPALARKVRLKLYRDKHIGGVDVTGDPSGLQRSTTNEDGVNNYTIIVGTFGKGVLRPKVKLLRKQPPQVTRCEFVNEVFDGYNGWEVQIDVKCRNLTRDLIYQLRNEDGTKSKQKTTDPKTGVKYERYGHLSDCLDYLLCYYLRDSWYKFKSGDANGYIVSTSVIQEGFSY